MNLSAGPIPTQLVSTRALLAQMGSTDSLVFLTESGRQGAFFWVPGNVSASVTADPLQGVWVAPASDTSGASGAWARKIDDEIHLAWWGLDLTGTTPNDTAINACFAYAASFISLSRPASLQFVSRLVILPAGFIGFSTHIDIPEAVNTWGPGSRACVFLALNAAAGLTVLFSSEAEAAGGNYGYSHQGWSVHGNNITTGWLLEVQGVSPRFDDITVKWGLGDGLVLNGTQNGLFTRCDQNNNGNPGVIPPTGANVRFTAGAAGNTVIRSETQEAAAYSIVFGGGTSDNVVIHGETEAYKGEYTSEYYPTGNIGCKIIAHVLCDGTEGTAPYGSPPPGNSPNKLIGHEASFYGTGPTAGAACIQLINGAQLIVSDIDHTGDDSAGLGASVTTFCQLGPNTGGNTGVNKLFMHGVNNLRGHKNVFLDASTTAGYGYVDIFGETLGASTNFFASNNTSTQDGVIRTPLAAGVTLTRGQLQFPSTQNPSTGSTTLDDYREGSGTGALALTIGGSSTGITYSQGPSMNYVKVGQLVKFVVEMTVTSIASLTGNVGITGLPVPASNLIDTPGDARLTLFTGVTLPSGYSASWLVTRNTSAMALNLFSNANGTAAASQAVFTSFPAQLRISGEYLSAT
jgi:hypothetical protein